MISKEYAFPKDVRIYFLLICVTSALLAFTTQTYLISDQIYFLTYGERLNVGRIQQLLLFKDQWQWVSYLTAPLLIAIKVTSVSFCLSIGCFLFCHEVDFRKLFKVCLVGEAIFLIPALIKIIWFSAFQTEYTLNDLVYFAPVSLVNFFDASEPSGWFIYPLQLINLFEVLYWVIISRGLQQTLKTSFRQSFLIVASSYGAGLLLWMIFVVFLQLNFS